MREKWGKEEQRIEAKEEMKDNSRKCRAEKKG